MKKLMIAASAALCATVGFSLESANVVGYGNVQTEAVKQRMFGFTFVPVAGGDSVKLGSVKATGMAGGADMIQVINPTTLGTSAQYTYYSDAQAKAEAMEESEGDPEVYEEVYAELKELIGWWAGRLGGTSANDVDIDVGSGFLGLSADKNNISFECAGSVPLTATSYAPGAVKSPIVANYLPVSFYLKDLVVDNMAGGADMIQVIDPETLGTTAQYTYYSAAQAEAEAMEESEGDPEVYEEVYAELSELIGWWSGRLGGTSADNVVVKPGDAFLGLSADANALTFNFKSALEVTPVAE